MGIANSQWLVTFIFKYNKDLIQGVPVVVNYVPGDTQRGEKKTINYIYYSHCITIH